jgi:hypothetical protein
MPKATRHVGLFMDEDLFQAVEAVRFADRHPSRSAALVTLLRAGLDAGGGGARKRNRLAPQAKEEGDDEWLALEREAK